MTVKELLSRIDSAELAEWMAYERIDPFGNERGDLRAGIIASTVANCSVAVRAKTKPGDFMPSFGRRVRQSVESIMANFKAYNDSINRRRAMGK